MWRSLWSELCFVLVFQLTTWSFTDSLEAAGAHVEHATADLEVSLASTSSNCPDTFVHAVKRNQHDKVKELLARDDTLKTCLTSFQTTFMPAQVTGLALHLAADLGFAKVLKALLDGGVDPNAPTTSGEDTWWAPQSTALMFAAVAARAMEAVNILLGAKDIKIYAQSQNDLTALILAACRGNDKVVLLLVEKDASGVNLQSQAGKSALMEASQRGYREVVDVLLEVPGIDLNLKIPDDASEFAGYTALMLSLLETEEPGPQPEWENLPTCRPSCPNIFEGIVKLGGTHKCADCTADIEAQTEPCCSITLENGEPVCVKDGDVWYGGNTVDWRQCADKDWGCYVYLSNDLAAESRACADRMLATLYFPDKSGVYWWHDDQARQRRPENRVCGTCPCCMRTEVPQFVPNDRPICGPDVKLGQVAACEVPSNEKLKGLVLTDALGNNNCDRCQVKYDGSYENEKTCDCKLSCPAGTVGTVTSIKCQKSGTQPSLTSVLKCDLFNNKETECLAAKYRDDSPCCWVPPSWDGAPGICAGLHSPLMPRVPAQCARMWSTDWEVKELPTCTPLCEWDAAMEKTYNIDLKLEFPVGSCSGKKPGELCEVKCQDGYEYGGGTEFSDFKCTADQENHFKASFPNPPVCQKTKEPPKPCDVAETRRHFPLVVTDKACEECIGDCKDTCGMFKCKDGYVPDPADTKGKEGFKKCVVEIKPEGSSACTRHSKKKGDCLKSMDQTLPGVPCCFMPMDLPRSVWGVCAPQGSTLFKEKRGAGHIVCADTSESIMEDTMPKCVPGADTRDIENIEHLVITDVDKCKKCAKGAVCRGCKMKCKPDEEWFGGKKEDEDIEIDDNGHWIVPICYQKNLPICDSVLRSSRRYFVPGDFSDLEWDTTSDGSTMCGNCFAGDKTCCQMECPDGFRANPPLTYIPCELVTELVDDQPAPVQFDLPEKKCEEIDKSTECIEAQENGQPCCWRDQGYKFSKLGEAPNRDNPSCLPMGSPKMYRYPSFRTNRPEGAETPFMCGIRQKAVYKTLPKCEATCGADLKTLPGLKSADGEYGHIQWVIDGQYICSRLDLRYCASLPVSGSRVDGSSIMMSLCDNSEEFKTRWLIEGTIKAVSNPKFCMTVPGEAGEGSHVIAGLCQSAAQWRIEGHTILYGLNPKYVMGVHGGHLETNREVTLWPGSRNPFQFVFDNQLIKVKADPHLCVCTETINYGDGSNIILLGCARTNEFLFTFLDDHIKLASDPKYCLCVREGKAQDGSDIILWTCDDSNDGRWVKSRDRIRWKADPKYCLSVQQRPAAQESKIIVQTCDEPLRLDNEL